MMSYPKRTDLWLVYIDTLTKVDAIESARWELSTLFRLLFESCFSFFFLLFPPFSFFQCKTPHGFHTVLRKPYVSEPHLKERKKESFLAPLCIYMLYDWYSRTITYNPPATHFFLSKFHFPSVPLFFSFSLFSLTFYYFYFSFHSKISMYWGREDLCCPTVGKKCLWSCSNSKKKIFFFFRTGQSAYGLGR